MLNKTYCGDAREYTLNTRIKHAIPEQMYFKIGDRDDDDGLFLAPPRTICSQVS